MSGYGKVISGGKAMTNGLTKNINGKLEGFSKGHAHGEMIANAVNKVFGNRHLSDPQVNDINGGKFKTSKTPKNA
jgi:hypothetical protein